jgi:hypothetical protein
MLENMYFKNVYIVTLCILKTDELEIEGKQAFKVLFKAKLKVFASTQFKNHVKDHSKQSPL